VAPLERAGADGARNGKDAARSAPAPETKRVAARSGSGHIKCWQYGRLVYESSNVAPPERKAQTVRGANGSSLQLYDMTSAFCVLEHSDR
ncbi:MAG TPA: hypothetical protein VM491_12145, partial [Burkholderiaceae bacterium]|nr:hypothetical protein [Burkholderiaceae bacterium]